MNAGQQKTVVFTDRERFERFLDILPEQKVQGIVEYLEHLASNGTVRISSTDIKELEDYEIQVRNSVAFFFANPKIQRRCRDFNTALGALYDFLDTNDLPVKEVRATELNALSQDFLRTYKEFLTTAMRELGEKSEIENVVKKGKKRVTLPKFPRTDWSRVSIRFIGERDVLLSDGKDTKPSDFEGLGCKDNRNERPDLAWKFFVDLAKGSGLKQTVDKKERELVKKYKQKITDLLRIMFKNDSDPFETEKGGVYAAKFVIGYAGDENAARPHGKYADLEAVRSEMTEPRDDE